jgi:hypothetical protein
MSFSARQLAAAGIVALTLGAGPDPALAAPGSFSTSAVKATTPLTLKLRAERNLSQTDYSNPDCSFTHPSCMVDTGLHEGAQRTAAAARSVDRVPADSAQLPAKLEWVLGADLQSQGDNNLEYAEQDRIDHRNASGAMHMIAQGLLDYRISNYYLANADAELGLPHRALAAEPNRLVYGHVTAAAARPLIKQLPTGSLVAAIDSAAPLVDESIPSEFRTISYADYETATAYYATVVTRLHVTSAQAPAKAKWLQGVHTLQRGDEQLGHVAVTSGVPLNAKSKHETASAFTTLRRASSQINQAETMLGIHGRQPAITLPRTITGFLGTGFVGMEFPVTVNPA